MTLMLAGSRRLRVANPDGYSSKLRTGRECVPLIRGDVFYCL